MNTPNQNDARPSGQDAAGSAQAESERLAKVLGASVVVDVGTTEPFAAMGVYLQRQKAATAGAQRKRKVTIPCEFHIFLPKAGTRVEPARGALRTLIWDPCTGRPLGREPFEVPQWENGGCLQLLNVEGNETLLLVGEVLGTHIEVPEKPLEWMPDPTAELQSVYGSGFMTFDPRDFFMGHVPHAFGAMNLEPNLPVDFAACKLEAGLGNYNLWEQGLVEFSQQAADNGWDGGEENLQALRQAGIFPR